MLKFLGLAAIGGGEISLALHIATAFAVYARPSAGIGNNFTREAPQL